MSVSKLFISAMCVISLGLNPASAVLAPPVHTSSEIMYKNDGYSYYLHTVKRKQTLYSIARAYRVSVEDILKANPQIENNEIKNKQQIAIPTPATLDSFARALEKEQAQTDSIKLQELEQERIEDSIKQAQMVIQEQFDNPLWNLPRMGEDFQIVVMLPFGSGTMMDRNLRDIANGVLLGVKELQSMGRSISVKIISSAKDAQGVQQIVDEGKLDGANLVIGPIYPEQIAPVAQWAVANGAVVVSPLSEINLDNPYVLQFPSSENTKYSEIFSQIDPQDDNIILINPASGVDKNALESFKSFAPAASVVNYSRATSARSMLPLLEQDKRNVIFVPIASNSVEEILSKVAALNAPISKYDITVVGTSRWRSQMNMDNYDLMFKTKVMFPVSYSSSMLTTEVAAFYKDYADSFGALPTLFSMRGYDVVMVADQMRETLGEDALVDLDTQQFRPLGTSYHFEKEEGLWKNKHWVVKKHQPNYQIDIK